MSNLRNRLAMNKIVEDGINLKKDDIIICSDNSGKNKYFLLRVEKDTEVKSSAFTTINLWSPNGFFNPLMLRVDNIKKVLPYVENWYEVYESGLKKVEDENK